MKLYPYNSALKGGGIYQIINTVNGKTYIGSAILFYKRFHVHISLLRRGKHGNVHLQNAFSKYGIDCFQWEIIKTVNRADNISDRDYLTLLLKYEQFYIDAFDAYESGYNRAHKAGSNIGYKLSFESKKKISRSKTKYNRYLLYTLSGEFHTICNSINEVADIAECDSTLITKSLRKGGKCRNYMVLVYYDDYKTKIEPYKRKGELRSDAEAILVIGQNNEIIKEIESFRKSMKLYPSTYLSIKENKFVNTSDGFLKFVKKSEYKDNSYYG